MKSNLTRGYSNAEFAIQKSMRSWRPNLRRSWTSEGVAVKDQQDIHRSTYSERRASRHYSEFKPSARA